MLWVVDELLCVQVWGKEDGGTKGQGYVIGGLIALYEYECNEYTKEDPTIPLR